MWLSVCGCACVHVCVKLRLKRACQCLSVSVCVDECIRVLCVANVSLAVGFPVCAAWLCVGVRMRVLCI